LIHDAEYIQKHYLSLTETEEDKIGSITRRRYARSSQEEIALQIDQKKSKWLNVKSNNLARRVAPWCAEELSERLTPILMGLKSSDPEVKKKSALEMKELLSTTKIQAQKILMLHCAALAVFAISACVAVASLVLCPPLIPLTGIAAMIITSTISGLAYQGMIKQRGWKFCPSDCIPNFVKIVFAKTSAVFSNIARQSIMPSA
jgi:hypothetical protein